MLKINSSIVNVSLENHSYEIEIGIDAKQALQKFLGSKNYQKFIVITDQNIEKIYPNFFSEILPNHISVVVEVGEKSKSFTTLSQVCEKILSNNIDRKTLLIAFGGGVIGDLAGFCASILLRGIDFIQIPTTLLSMVDSSVGGKTAINSSFGKNLIGTFYQPKKVIIDLKFLSTLALREFRSGYGEVVKYGLIYDQNFFKYLEINYSSIFNQNQDILTEVVKKCCQIKALIVSNDEKESSEIQQRILLNFGHTFAHVFETQLNYSDQLLHGEAVALGMLMAMKMSQNFGYIQEIDYQRLLTHLLKCEFMVDLKKFSENWHLSDLSKNLFKDKKVENNQLVFILLSSIGKAFVKKDVSVSEFEKILKLFW